MPSTPDGPCWPSRCGLPLHLAVCGDVSLLIAVCLRYQPGETGVGWVRKRLLTGISSVLPVRVARKAAHTPASASISSSAVFVTICWVDVI
jgi:hypothetical protein